MQPGPEPGLAAEPGQAVPGSQERVLGGVLRILMVMQHGQRDTVSPPGVTARKLIEGLQVTLLTAPDQLRVRRLIRSRTQLPGPGTAVPLRNNPGHLSHEITRRRRLTPNPPGAATAGSGPARPHGGTRFCLAQLS
jgi:hypothetical protein